MARFRPFSQTAIFTALVVCALGQTKAAFATCGDYLQFSEQHSRTSIELSLTDVGHPDDFPASCASGRCRNAPEKSPLGTSTPEYRTRIRTLTALQQLLDRDVAQDELGRWLPVDERRPESVCLERPDPPPRSRA